DEIFCKALSDSGKENFLDWKYEKVEPLHTALHRTPLSKEDFVEDENLALNAVKHMAPASYRVVIFDAEDAAYAMIVRTLTTTTVSICLVLPGCSSSKTTFTKTWWGCR